MSIARDISRQTSRQIVTLTADQTAVTVTGGFSSSTVEVYLNGAKLVQGSDYSLNGTSGITLTQGASVGDIIEFSIRNSSNSGLSAVNTDVITDGAVTFAKLSNSSTDSLNAQKRGARSWVVFDGRSSTGIAAGNADVSFNVSSVVENSVGNYTVNFETAMADTHYPVAFAHSDGIRDSIGHVMDCRVHTHSTNYIQFQTLVDRAGASPVIPTAGSECQFISVIVFGP